jgi:hypothetical protein
MAATSCARAGYVSHLDTATAAPDPRAQERCQDALVSALSRYVDSGLATLWLTLNNRALGTATHRCISRQLGCVGGQRSGSSFVSRCQRCEQLWGSDATLATCRCLSASDLYTPQDCVGPCLFCLIEQALAVLRPQLGPIPGLLEHTCPAKARLDTSPIKRDTSDSSCFRIAARSCERGTVSVGNCCLPVSLESERRASAHLYAQILWQCPRESCPPTGTAPIVQIACS